MALKSMMSPLTSSMDVLLLSHFIHISHGTHHSLQLITNSLLELVISTVRLLCSDLPPVDGYSLSKCLLTDWRANRAIYSVQSTGHCIQWVLNQCADSCSEQAWWLHPVARPSPKARSPMDNHCLLFLHSEARAHEWDFSDTVSPGIEVEANYPPKCPRA